MIVAKAANTELVQLYKMNGKWHETRDQFNRNNGWAFFEDAEYFLCLPQHKEACLHWLNDGEVQINMKGEGFLDWCRPSRDWKKEVSFMFDINEFRIKPKKKKRWIGYCANTNQTFPHPQKSKEVAEDYAARSYGYKMSSWQFIEIEVEV